MQNRLYKGVERCKLQIGTACGMQQATEACLPGRKEAGSRLQLQPRNYVDVLFFLQIRTKNGHQAKTAAWIQENCRPHSVSLTLKSLRRWMTPTLRHVLVASSGPCKCLCPTFWGLAYLSSSAGSTVLAMRLESLGLPSLVSSEAGLLGFFSVSSSAPMSTSNCFEEVS